MFQMCDFWMYSVNLGVLIRKGVNVSLNTTHAQKTSQLMPHLSLAKFQILAGKLGRLLN